MIWLFPEVECSRDYSSPVPPSCVTDQHLSLPVGMRPKVPCNMWVLAVVLISIHGIQATSGSTQDWWGVSPSECRATVDAYDVSCHWKPPPSVPAEDCQLFFRITPGHYHFSEPFCSDVSVWTACLYPQEGNVCSFAPDHVFGDSVFGYCGDFADMRVQCNDTMSEAVTIDNYKSIRPDPVANLRTEAVGATEVNVTWDLPLSWMGSESALHFVINPWDEFSLHHDESVVFGYEDPVGHCSGRSCSYILTVDYGHTHTCARVAVYNGHNPLELKSWTEMVCGRTHGAAPISPPTSIEVTLLQIDNDVRVVNVSWHAVPKHDHGGPDLWYVVSAKDDDGNVTARCNVSQPSCVMEVYAYRSYTFEITAVNADGKSNVAVSDVFYALEPKNVSRHLYLIGTVGACLVIILVVISGILILRKKMRATHLSSITLPEKVVTVDLTCSKKAESEVFDTLKTLEPLVAHSGPPPYSHKGVDGPRVSPKRNRQAPLMTLEIPEELMPLAIDAYPQTGEVSPTDSGHGEDQSGTSYEVSPIPMSFLPNGRSSSQFGGYDERQALVPSHPVGDRDDSDRNHIDTELPPLIRGTSVDGRSVPSQREATGPGPAPAPYTPQSEGSSLGYVQQALPSSHNSSSPTGQPPYIAEPRQPGSNGVASGSMISSYVQHGEATPPPHESSRDVGLPTSEGSDCPPYVKQTSTVEQGI